MLDPERKVNRRLLVVLSAAKVAARPTQFIAFAFRPIGKLEGKNYEKTVECPFRGQPVMGTGIASG
jgi:hypothetical protein